MLPVLTSCEAPEEVCCTAFFDLAVAILDVVVTDLNECNPPSDCVPPIIGYATVGSMPDEALCDTVVVAVTGVRPWSGVNQTKMVRAPLHQVGLTLRLLESGFPVARAAGEAIVLPDPELVHIAAKHSYAHGERMYRTVINAFVGPQPIMGCTAVSVDDFSALDAQAGCVGWRLSLTVQVPL